MVGFFGAERLGDDLALLADQHFDAGLGLFELLRQVSLRLHAALKEVERTIEREVAPFQFFDDLFEFVEAGFERFYGLGRLVFRHGHILACGVGPMRGARRNFAACQGSVRREQPGASLFRAIQAAHKMPID